MEPFAHAVKVSLPRYLAQLPIPDSFSGIFRLSFGDWLSLTPFFGIVAGTTYLTFKAFFSGKACGSPPAPPPESQPGTSRPQDKTKVNLTVKKDSPKVVDTCDIEEIGAQKVFCRCWRSQKFPYCDGSHTKHNEETGDNVGPLIIKK